MYSGERYSCDIRVTNYNDDSLITAFTGHTDKVICLILLSEPDLKDILSSEDVVGKFLLHVKRQKVAILKILKDTLTDLKGSMAFVERNSSIVFQHIYSILKLEQSIIDHHIKQLEHVISEAGEEALANEL